MSQRAEDYVDGLGPDRVTAFQKFVLMVIAREISERYGTANFPLENLCAIVLRSRGHMGRVFKSLDHILGYKPGLGKGNFSQFWFIELAAEKAAERLHKGSILDAAIRKENLTLIQKQSPPAPLSGGWRTLPAPTRRDIRRVNDLMMELEHPCCTAARIDHRPGGWISHDYRPALDPETAMASACAKLCVPLEAAKSAMWEAGLEIGRKKESQKATA